jgi:hypothetical protein
VVEYICTNRYCLAASHPSPRCPRLPAQRLPPYNASERRSLDHIRQLEREGRLPRFEYHDARWPWWFALGVIALVALGLMLLI